METKKLITDELNRLKPFGFEVLTFNNNRAFRSAQKNFPDHFITNGKYIVFVEVKLTSTKDKLSEGQEKLCYKLSSASVYNKHTHMKFIKSVADAKRLVELLLKGEL
ncbi:MAG: hypothetical protein WC677_08855 [Clostridia bacterium]|jgi:hypothetical protein